jgi:hypothetical protein
VRPVRAFCGRVVRHLDGAFRGGDAVDGNGDAVATVLAPLITDRDGNWARVTTLDGGSDVFGVNEPASGLTFNHTTGRAIWAVMFDVARLGGFTVMPVGCPACVPPGVAVEDLPENVARDVRSIATGDVLRRAIGAS